MNELLLTKLRAPVARPNLVSRLCLVQRLNEGLHPSRRLILVSAPAGYGKTTLVTEWLAQAQVKSAWLSLDEADNDPARFLAYLIAALENANGQMKFENARTVLQSAQPLHSEVVLTAIINAIALVPDTMILVLDDYHIIRTPAIHQQISFLLERQPIQMHLVLVTREDPLLPIARLRARGEIVEIRQQELRFSLEECADFLQRVMGVRLGSEKINALERRTEGWIVGLQLAALSMQGRSDLSGFVQTFTGSSRFILDYLIEEVFERQSAEVKDFLLKTSILEHLSGSLCEAMTDNVNSHRLLENLEQSNLFIVPLDPAGLWYRYHHLFSDLLRHRLRELGQPLVDSLHLRASQWYEAEGYLAEAIQHAIEAKDWERSAGLIEKASEAYLKRGELITLIGWCEKLPQGVVAARPGLGLGYAWALSLLGQFDKADDLLAQIEELAGSIPALMGQVASVQAYVARGKGDNTRAIAKSQQALSLLPPGDSSGRGLLALNVGVLYWHEGQLTEAAQILSEIENASRRIGNWYAVFTAQIFLARTLASQGELHRAERMYQHIIRDGGEVPILALAYYDLGGIYYEWNDLAIAGEFIEKGMDLCKRSGNVEFQNAGHILRAFLFRAQGETSSALAEVEISHTLARDFNPATRSRSAAAHAQIALAVGDVDTAAHWMSYMTDDVDAHPFYRFVGLIRPRLLVAQGMKDAASELLESYSERADEAGWGYAKVAIHILQSLAAERKETACEILEKALYLAKAEGYIRAFIDAGRPLLPLLQECAIRGIAPEYVGQILDGFRDGQNKGVSAASQLVEPLSERELEVLRLVTAGLSNREISATLVVSLGTAKTHIHHICGKLGVRNRTEAAMRAKELKLV